MEPEQNKTKAHLVSYVWGFNPFKTAVEFGGQTTQISSSLYPKRDCGSKRVKVQFSVYLLVRSGSQRGWDGGHNASDICDIPKV